MAGIIAGLAVGKPLGVFLAAAAAVRKGTAAKPPEYTWRQLAGAGALAGIGFTMSLFIAGRAFPDCRVCGVGSFNGHGNCFVLGRLKGALPRTHRTGAASVSIHG